ncbi:MAG: hypothetical protein PHN69_07800 [Candidatus Pacebacteria bacterium]|nr:hypothetical protein [Candidatus Paceibacterota bacterium]
MFPFKPKQLVDPDENAHYCHMWETYSAFSEEAEKQTKGQEKFGDNQ